MDLLSEQKRLSVSARLALAALCASLPAGACTDFKVAPEGEDAGAGQDAARRTVSGDATPEIAIPDDDARGIDLVVAITEGCQIESVEIDVEIQHTYRGDVALRLTSPEGTLIVLKDVVDEDEGFDVIGTYPTTLVPVQSLDGFAGEEAMGTWTLTAIDLGQGDEGTLEAWGVRAACSD